MSSKDRLAGLSLEEKKALLQQLLDKKKSAAARPASPPPLVPQAHEGPPEASFAQERLWFLEQLEGGDGSFALADALRLEGPLDVGALERAVAEIIRRHQSLRTSFVEEDGRPRQQIHPAGAPLRHVDLRAHPDPRGEAQRWYDEACRRRFDLRRAPLFEAELLRLGEREHVLVLAAHHVVTDGWSVDVFHRELKALYAAFAEGRPSPLPELPVQYADFAVWQRRHLSGHTLERQLGFWKEALAGAPELCALRTDRPRPKTPSHRGAMTAALPLGGEAVRALRELAKAQKLTSFMVYLAGFQAVLHRLTGQGDVVVGTALAGRETPELEALIGFFVNAVALRTQLGDDPSFAALLERTRRTTLDALAHQDVPFDRVVDAVGHRRDTAHAPLFQVGFLHRGMPAEVFEVHGLRASTLKPTLRTSRFDLTLLVNDTPEGVAIAAEYATDLFDAATVERLLESYRVLIEAAARTPSVPLSRLPLLSDEARAQVRQLSEAPRTAEPPATLISLFEAQARRRPEAVALRTAGGALTYAALDERANRLARLLRARGVGLETRVAILTDRSEHFPLAVLAILKAGGAYVPLDAGYPDERISGVLQSSGVALGLGDAEGAARGRALGALPWLELGAAVAESAALPGAPLEPVCLPESLAYVIHTSGSTGRPKGVEIEHRAIANFARHASKAFGIHEESRLLQFAPLGFDGAVAELFFAFATGGSLCIAPRAQLMMGPELIRTLQQFEVSFSAMPPSALAALPPEELPALQTVAAVGEACSVAVVQRWSDGRTFFNGYGPTEAAVGACCTPLTGDEPTTPIGRPFTNTALYVLDAALQPVPIGVPGELYIGGAQLARGYTGRPDATAERFVPSPFGPPGSRLYRTGDLAWLRADGRLEFVGRVDGQVKLRGYRIELGEILSVLERQPGVGACTVVLREDAPGQKRLVAYFTPAADGRSAEPAALRAALRETLPEYMVPAALVPLARLPVTPNGKVDLRALPAPSAPAAEAAAKAGPRTPAEALLLSVWSEVLRADGLGIHDNFFEVGGDSILSMQVVSRAAAKGLRLTAAQLFEHQTVARLAAVAETARKEDAPRDEGPVTGPYPLTPIQAWFLRGPARHSHFNQDVLLEAAQPVDASALQRALDAVFAHHDALRARFTTGPDGAVQAELLPPAPVRLHRHTVSGPDAERQAEEAGARLQRGFDLAEGALFQAALIQGGTRDRLLLVAHHLVIDAVSWGFLLADLETAYGAALVGAEISLPPRTTSFRQWAEALSQYARSDAEALRTTRDFYRRQPWGEVQPLPRNPGGENTRRHARTLTAELPAPRARALFRDAQAAFRAQPNEVLAFALAEALAGWSGGEVVSLALEGHGREPVVEADLSRTVGWFTSLFPVCLDLRGSADPADRLLAVKEQLRAVPLKGLGYGLLRHLAGEPLPAEPEVLFNYLGAAEQVASAAGAFRPLPGSLGPAEAEEGPRPMVLEVNATTVRGAVSLSFTWSQSLHSEQTVRALADRMLGALERLARVSAEPSRAAFSPSDFPLAGLDAQGLAALGLSPREVEDIYGLTPLQQGILFHALERPGTGVYVLQSSRELRGEVRLDAFEEAFRQVLARHPLLRTSFHWEGGALVQVVHRKAELPFLVEDLRGLGPDAQRARVEAFLAEDLRRGFELSRAPLMRLAFHRLADDRWQFTLTSHHLILDGWSSAIVLQDFRASYRALVRGTGHAPPAPPSFRDYVRWLRGQTGPAEERFWRELFEGFHAPTNLPVHRAVRGEPGHRVTELDEAETKRLEAFTRAQATTPNTVTLAAWAVTLARHHGRWDVCFGITLAGRPPQLPRAEELVGPLINTLPLRLRLDPEEPVSQLVARIQRQLLEVLARQSTPLPEVQRWSGLSGTPLFDTLVVFESYPGSEAPEDGLFEITDVQGEEGTHYQFVLEAMPSARYGLRAVYDGRLDGEDAGRVLRGARSVLLQLVADPAATVGSLSVVDPEDRPQLLETFNASDAAFPVDRELASLFEAQVRRRPEAPAVTFRGETLSYAELDARANGVAHALRAEGLGPESVVALMDERGSRFLTTILGVFKAGAAYLPLDPQHPPSRIAQVLAASGARHVLCAAPLAAKVAEAISEAGTGARLLPLDGLDTRPTAEAPPRAVGPRSLAYVIFTSGSTGVPKGAMVEQEGMVNHLFAKVADLQLGEADAVAQNASQCFDISVWQFLVALVVGGRTVVYEDEVAQSPALLAEAAIRDRLTVLELVPSLLRAVVEELGARPTPPPLGLRWMVPTGEALPPALCRDWFALYPHIPLVNAYGPTECSDDVTHCVLTAPPAALTTPIGRPVGNMRLYVLDERLRPAPLGCAGELYVGGVGVGRGYLGRPDLTAERFLPDPFSARPGARLYRTGDLGRWLPDGNLEFLGRVDFQVKLRGFRIELGEIEAALESQPGVKTAVCAATDEGAAQRLVAYVVPHPGHALDASALASALRARLPEYMVPQAFLVLEALPLTSNGKVDRKRMPAPPRAAETAAAHVPPANAVEAALCEIWAKVLRLDQVSTQANFFELGGDSILAIQIVSLARRARLQLSPRALFTHPTVAALARVAQPLAEGHAAVPKTPGHGPLRLLPIGRWLAAQPDALRRRYNQDALWEFTEPVEPAALRAALDAVVAHHDALRLRVTDWDLGVAQIPPPGPAALKMISVAGLPEQAQRARLREEAEALHAAMDPVEGPLFQAVCLQRDGGDWLLLVAHHLVMDAVSWGILQADVELAYRQLREGRPVALPESTTSYRAWSARLVQRAGDADARRRLLAWADQPFAGVVPLPRELPGENRFRTQRSHLVTLDADDTQTLLTQLPQAYRAQLHEALLASLGGAVTSWSGGEVMVDVEGHGREDAELGEDLSRTVGWFTSLTPLRLGADGGMAEMLLRVKESLRTHPGRGLDFGVFSSLSEDADLQRRLSAVPRAELAFNYLGQEGAAGGAEGLLRDLRLKTAAAEAPDAPRPYLIEVNAWVRDGQLTVDLAYGAEVHRKETIAALGDALRERLRALAALCRDPAQGGVSPSDFPLAALDPAALARLTENPRDLEDVYPLSPLQQGLLFHALQEGGGVYVIQLAYQLLGPLDLDLLERAWTRAAERHPILRTTFHWDGPLVQAVHRPKPVTLQRLDWADAADPEARLQAFLTADRAQPFAFSEAPPFRVAVARLGAERHQVILTIHHVLVDGWSMGLLLQDVLALYRRERDLSAPPLPPAAAFRDYVAWLSAQRPEDAERYWRELMAGFSGPTPLPIVRPRTGPALAQQALHHLGADELRPLEALARAQQVTLNAVVQAAWSVLLSRYANNPDVVFGVTLSGRPPELAGADRIVGLMINTLPMRVHADDGLTVEALLRAVRDQQGALLTHQHTPLSTVQGLTGVARGQALFDTVLIFENYPDAGARADAELSLGETQNVEATHYPLTVEVVASGGLSLRVLHDDRVAPEAVHRLVQHLRTLLRQMAERPSAPLGTLSLVDAEERALLLGRFNAVEAPRPLQTPFIDRFEAQVRARPDAVAVGFRGETLRYAELDARANRLAHALRAQGVTPGALVAVLDERSPRFLTAILALFKLGAGYVPLDPHHPAKRMAQVLEAASPRWLLVSAAKSELAAAALAEAHLAQAPRLTVYDGLGAGADGEGRTPQAARELSHVAYVMFTSGSTGAPKGVMVEQAALLNHLEMMVAMLGLGPSDVLAQTATQCFDISVWQFLTALMVGGRTEVYGDEVAHLPAPLLAALERDGVTCAELVPSLLRAVTEAAQTAPAPLSRLRWMVSVGEALPSSLCEAWFSRWPQIPLVNAYGPTECGDNATHQLLRAAPPAGIAPVGTHAANMRVYVLDAALNPAPLGIPGEIYVGGGGLARGYLGRPDLTAERFLPDPFAPAPGGRMYRTGDLGRFREDGTLEYLGRVDFQVKVRGFRIELGDIEAALRKQPAVRDAVVTAWQPGPGDTRLVAYVRAGEGAAVQSAELRAALRATLPEYMVPSAFVFLDAFPLNANGKVDRKRLPAPTLSRAEPESYAPPRTEVERTLARVWAEVLRQPQVGLDDNFFELGGDSILSMQVVGRAAAEGLEVTPPQLFELQTLRALAPAVRRRDAVVRGPAEGRAPLLPLQRWFFETLGAPAHFNQSLALEAEGPVQPEALQRALDALWAHHHGLRARFPEGGACAQIDPAHTPPPQLLTRDGRGWTEDRLAAEAAALEAGFDLAHGPLLRAALLTGAREGRDVVLVVAHHLVVDALSWDILAVDLEAAYRDAVRGVPPALPAPSASVRGWAEALARFTARAEGAQQFWRTRPFAQAARLPRELPGENTRASARSLTLRLPAALTAQAGAAFRASVEELLLAAVAETVSDWTGGEVVQVDAEGHGRETIVGEDGSRTVGWLASLYPVVVRRPDAADPVERLTRLKEQLREIPHRGVGAPLPTGEVLFNYLGRVGPDAPRPGALFRRASLGEDNAVGTTGLRSHLLEWNCALSGDSLDLTLTFSAAIHPEATARRLLQAVSEKLQTLAHLAAEGRCAASPSDFPLVNLTARHLQRFGPVLADLEELLPLTPLQQGFLYRTLERQGAGVYVIQAAYRLLGALDRAAWAAAWEHVVQAHPILRTAFEIEGLPDFVQAVHRKAPVDLTFEDWSGLEDASVRAKAAAVLDAERARPFPLGRPGGLSVRMARLSPEAHQVVVSVHHLLVDGWSLTLLMDQVMAEYEAVRAGRPPRPRGPSFGAYVRWLRAQDPARSDAFWRERMAGVREPTPLPLVKNSTEGAHHAQKTVRLNAERFGAIARFARAQHLTLNAVVQAAWAITLSRYAGTGDVLYGMVVSGRPPELEGAGEIVGPLVNALPVRCQVDEALPVRTFLAQFQREQQALLEHQHSPLTSVQRHTQLPPGAPFFDAIFVFENYPDSDEGARAASLQIELPEGRETTHHPLCLQAVADQALALTAMYDDRMEPSTVEALLESVVNLLERFPGADRPLVELSMLNEAGRQRLLSDFNPSRREVPFETPFHLLFEERVRQHPDAPAVTFRGETLSYDALNQRANRLARELRALGVGPESVVALMDERGSRFLIAMLAVFKAGAAYVPLDPRHPPLRIGQVLTSARASVVISSRPLLPRVEDGISDAGLAGRVRVLHAEAVGTHPDGSNLGLPVDPSQLAYVIFTSGSTGVPKGAMVEQRGMVNHLFAKVLDLELTAGDVVAQTASQCFDISVWQFLVALVVGGRTVVYEDEVAQLPPSLLEATARDGITILELVPSMLRAVVEEVRAQSPRPALPALRWMVPTGEALPPPLCRDWFELFPTIPLMNAYGPTECSDDVTHHRLWAAPAGVTTPVGRPVANMRSYVLNAALEPLPVGVIGELYIGGVGVGRGYVGRPDATAEKFLPDPFSDAPGARLYRTGDRARWAADGTVEFLGRIDFQVKLRGLRIELGEIEVGLQRCDGIRDAVVVVHGEGQAQQLVAYLVASGAPPPVQALRAQLQRTVPDYMIPQSFLFLEALPLTSNGKVDRKALPAPSAAAGPEAEGFVAPRGPDEHTLASLWQELLGVERVGVRDNFYELGGSSILLARLSFLIRERMGVEVSILELLTHPTVEALALALSTRSQRTAETLHPLRAQGSRPPLFCVHDLLGSALVYGVLTTLLDEDQPVYAVQAPEMKGGPVFPSFEARAAYYVEQIRTVSPSGPYRLLGYSSGGLLAFEMARQLRAAGHVVEFLGLLDTALDAARGDDDGMGSAGEGDVVGWFVEQLARSVDEVREAAPGEGRLQTVLQHLQSQAILDRTAGLEDLERLARMISDTNAAVARYQPQRYDGPAHLLVCAETAERYGQRLGWDGVLEGAVTVQPIPGTHVTAISYPAVREVAERLRESLRAR